MHGITDVLNSYDGQGWSAICGSFSDAHAQLDAKNSQWIYTKGPNCYFLLWVIWKTKSISNY